MFGVFEKHNLSLTYIFRSKSKIRKFTATLEALFLKLLFATKEFEIEKIKLDKEMANLYSIITIIASLKKMEKNHTTNLNRRFFFFFAVQLIELRRNPQGTIDKRLRATLRPTSKMRRDSTVSELEERFKDAQTANQKFKKQLRDKENEIQVRKNPRRERNIFKILFLKHGKSSFLSFSSPFKFLLKLFDISIVLFLCLGVFEETGRGRNIRHADGNG